MVKLLIILKQPLLHHPMKKTKTDTMNWGTKIALGLASFMIFIITLGLLMFNSKKDALVDNDYYEKGINYDQEYQRREQTVQDHASPELVVNAQMILLSFKEQASGKVKLMRTADKNLDRQYQLETNINQQVIIPVAGLEKGSWRLIAEWRSSGKSYVFEKEIHLK